MLSIKLASKEAEADNEALHKRRCLAALQTAEKDNKDVLPEVAQGLPVAILDQRIDQVESLVVIRAVRCSS